MASEATQVRPDTTFNPKIHLAQDTDDIEVLNMADLGFGAKDELESQVAVSHPFQLFNNEAVEMMKHEVLQPAVEEKFGCVSHKPGLLRIRGYPSIYAPFTHRAWKHPETLQAISRIAGVDLVPAMEYEIGHINVMQQESPVDWNQGWHRDAYPFVCIVFLSDSRGMEGGEVDLLLGSDKTVLNNLHNRPLRIRGGAPGSAIILQGKEIAHRAWSSLNGNKRITMLTSFRPKSPFAADSTSLSTVRTISDTPELYHQFFRYRLENMSARIDAELARIRNSRMRGTKFDVESAKAWLAAELASLAHTDNEIVESVSYSGTAPQDFGMMTRQFWDIKPDESGMTILEWECMDIKEVSLDELTRQLEKK